MKLIRLLTLSPHIVLLDHVRNVDTTLLIPCHVPDWRMTLKNLVSGSTPARLMLGICILKDEDFRRYGKGGCCVIVYAITLLRALSMMNARNLFTDVPWMCHVLLAFFQGNLINLPFTHQGKQTPAGYLRVSPVRQTLQ